jgi:hypothetical protein
MSDLYRLTLTDRIDRRLTGRDGHRYASPPLPLADLCPLAAILLGRDQIPPIPGSFRAPIAGGQRLIEITPATS